MKNTKKNIGLFGSSFNPPHLGHLAVIKDLLNKKIFGEIWLIPVFSHAFQKKMETFETRLKMTELLVEELQSSQMRICTIEKDMNKKPSYTYDVITALIDKYPDTKFTIILGTDTQNELHKWYNYTELKKIADFYFIPRKGYEDSPYPEVSSSQIRSNIKDNKPISGLTTEKIANYILSNNIYKDS